MNHYRAIIIDDEKNVREALEIMLSKNCPEIILCGAAASAEEGRELLSTNKIDIVFLDISMPIEDGFAFLQTIPKEQYSIIFVTAHEEHALRAIKASAIDYLLKPVNPFELREAVIKAIGSYQLRQYKTEALTIYKQSLDNLDEHINSKNDVIQKITVSDQYGFRIVNVSDLMYLQADNNYTILHLSGFEKIVASRPLGDFEKMLPSPLFLRIHKSNIINMNYLQAYSSYEGNYAKLTDGTSLCISRRKLLEFKEAITHLSKSLS